MRRLCSIGCGVFLLFSLLVPARTGMPFSFSEEQDRQVREEADRKTEAAASAQRLLSVPCKNSLKNKKIAVVIGERHSGDGQRVGVARGYGDGGGGDAAYGLLFSQINQRLRSVGLKTYSQSEIAAQVAQAEMEAFLNNNMDAAASAASRLGASFFLKGVIATRTEINPILKINEVFLTMAFTLVDASGRIVSDVTARGDAYSGQDTLAVALELVKEQADGVVAQLYSDYCAGGKR